MREVTETTDAAWRAEEKLQGAPIRATIEKAHNRMHPYNTADAPGGDYGAERDRRGNFASMLFVNDSDDSMIREIRGIKSLSWSRSVDQDVAEATLVLLNSDVTPIGSITEDSEDVDDPGRFTFSRGLPTISANRWGHDENEGWRNYLAPDRMIKTYEGYSSDNELQPAFDPELYLTGTWLIDSVDISTNGEITIKMRDLGRLLLDHISFPPVVPWEDYPLTWSKIHSEDVPGRAPTGGSWVVPRGSAHSSNEAYVNNFGESSWSAKLDDTPRYVGRWGGVQGHNAGDALHDYENDYWLSTGQESRKSMVWWEQDFATAHNVSAIKLRTHSGPYKVYVSIKVGDEWVGKRKIPYKVTTGDIDIDADKPYVFADIINRGVSTEIVLPRVYSGVTKVRLTFTRLRLYDDSAQNYRWRAGLKAFEVYTGTGLGFDTTGVVSKVVGNYRDWTDPVKWVCAWAGFWWPNSHADNNIQWSGDTKVHHDQATPDPVLPKGRVWGSFQPTGTAGVADATPDNFDKQPLMDVINYVRNIVGFFFTVDEVGGVVWRMPNLYSKGNYLTPHHLNDNRKPSYVDEHITIDEEVALIDYDTTLNSANLRERVFVANSNGKVGTVIKGYQPYSTGLRRVAGWTDEHFATNRECRVAADMIAARQMFDWRRATVTMPAHPGLQVDDQVRIFERVTNETFYHYVLGIESSHDAETGEWTYQVATHWLGERPSDAWVVRVEQLDAVTQAYLDNLGTVD